VNIEQLCFDCARAVIAGTGITLSLPKGERWPAGFPRGELLSVNLQGVRNVSFNPVRVLAWVQDSTKAMQTIYGDFQVTAATQTAAPIKGPL
jgi:hypothetical protein